MTTLTLPATCRLAIGRRVAVAHRGQMLLVRVMQGREGSAWLGRVVSAEGAQNEVGETVRLVSR